MNDKKTSAGLRGVSAGRTAVSACGADGHSLDYRGYAIGDLAARASFEEVAYLLLRGDLPTRAQLESFSERLRAARTLPLAVRETLEKIPRRRASDGCHAHRLLDAGRDRAGRRFFRASKKSPNDCLGFPVRARILEPLFFARRKNRSANRRRANRGTTFGLITGEAPDEVCAQAMNASLVLIRRARIQRIDFHRPRRRRDFVRFSFRGRGRDRRFARAFARRRQRSGDGDYRALRNAGCGARRDFANARRKAKNHGLRPCGLHRFRSA